MTLTEAVTALIPVQKSRSSETALNVTLSLQSKQVLGDKAERRNIGKYLLLAAS